MQQQGSAISGFFVVFAEPRARAHQNDGSGAIIEGLPVDNTVPCVAYRC
jgi:hypothetical protein